MSSTRAGSRRPSSADDVWRSEIDQELADLKSLVRGLSSTLRRLEGRESARQRRSQPSSSPAPSDPDQAVALKQRLREEYGLVPRRRRVPDAEPSTDQV
jgi:hypothetical protein